MKLNGVDVIVKCHQTRDIQEIRTFLESMEKDVVDVKVSAYHYVDNSPRFIAVVFCKA